MQANIARAVGWKFADGVGAAMTDYWVSKLFFDLQQDGKLAAEYRADMPGVLARYDIKPDIRKALLEDDVGKIAPLVNAYLLRFPSALKSSTLRSFAQRGPRILNEQADCVRRITWNRKDHACSRSGPAVRCTLLAHRHHRAAHPGNDLG